MQSNLAARVKHIDGKIHISRQPIQALSESLHTEGIKSPSAELYMLSKEGMLGIKGIAVAPSDVISSMPGTSQEKSLMQGFKASDP